MSKMVASNFVDITQKRCLAVASQPLSVAIICLFYLACLSITPVNANDTNKTSVVLDGLNLDVTFLNDTHANAAKAECVLTNTTSVPVPYEGTGPNMGFSFKLVDLAGNQIAKNTDWEKLNGVSDMSKHSAKMIEPKGTLMFSLPFAEAFSSPWRSGYRLLVEWNPGDDGKGNPLQTGKGLAAVLELKSDQDKTSATAPDPQETSSTTPSVVMQPTAPGKPIDQKPDLSTPSEEPSSSTPWSIIVVVVVAAVGLLWLLLKGRK